MEPNPVRRRVIWLRDNEWQALADAAAANGRNVSEEIRSVWSSVPPVPKAAPPTEPELRAAWGDR